MADYMHLNPHPARAARGARLEPVKPVQVEVTPNPLGLGQKFRILLGFSPAPEKVLTWAAPELENERPRSTWADRPGAPVMWS